MWNFVELFAYFFQLIYLVLQRVEGVSTLYLLSLINIFWRRLNPNKRWTCLVLKRQSLSQIILCLILLFPSWRILFFCKKFIFWIIWMAMFINLKVLVAKGVHVFHLFILCLRSFIFTCQSVWINIPIELWNLYLMM